MKKLILLSAALIVSASAVFAQPSAGNIVVGGSLTYNTLGGNTALEDAMDVKGRINLTGINPYAEYFIMDNLSVGLTIGYLGGTANAKLSADDYKMTMKYGASVFSGAVMAKYYMPITEKFFFTAGAQIGGGSLGYKTKVSDGDDSATDKENIGFFAISLVPGFSYFVNNRIVLTLSMGDISFRAGKLKDLEAIGGEDVSLNNFGINLNVPSIGVAVKF